MGPAGAWLPADPGPFSELFPLKLGQSGRACGWCSHQHLRAWPISSAEGNLSLSDGFKCRSWKEHGERTEWPRSPRDGGFDFLLLAAGVLKGSQAGCGL